MTNVYTVRLVRPIFQFVTIEVQALGSGSAVNKAMRRAKSLPDSEWKRRETGDDYAPHVEGVIDHQEIYETSANPHKEIKEFRFEGGNSDAFKYLVLMADLSTRVGRVLPQPWFANTEQTLQADLCADWAEPINFILENDGLGENNDPTIISSDISHHDNVIEFPITDPDLVPEKVESNS